MTAVADILARITEEVGQGLAKSRKAMKIAEKITEGTATYVDALEYAREDGEILIDSLARNLPDALTDGKLYRAEAEQVLRPPMERSGKRVAETAAEIQQRLNEEAAIGIRAIVPEVNGDQIGGIVTEICNAESFAAGAERLFTQIENYLEGTVDDCVRENADFQYQAGLSPTIERRTVGKCCAWCDRLAGIYDYADVKDKGNDVFRRHRNCHCIVTYNPGNGSKRRQNVHTRRWTNDDRNDRIKTAEGMSGGFTHTRVYNTDLGNGLPQEGRPNSIVDKLAGDGTVLQRRWYGPDGVAAMDIDMTDHHRPDDHPTGAHKHLWDQSTGKAIRSKINYPLTEKEIQQNADIIKPGVNYFDKKRTR